VSCLDTRLLAGHSRRTGTGVGTEGRRSARSLIVGDNEGCCDACAIPRKITRRGRQRGGPPGAGGGEVAGRK